MKVPSPKNRNSSFMTGAVLCVALLGMTTLPAQAGTSNENAVTVTMKVPEINTLADYNAVVKAFRVKASDACETTSGKRPIHVLALERECVNELVENFEEQLNSRFNTVTFDQEDKSVG